MTTHVVFENLGIDLLLNRRAFTFNALGGGIYWYAIIILTGFALAYLYVSREEKKLSGSTDTMIDIILFAVPISIIFARLYYCIFSWNSYKDNLSDIFKIWNGGLAIYGGVIGAFLTILIYCRIKKLPALHYFDLCATGLLIGQSVGRWGNFVNGEAYGGLVDESYILAMTVNGKGPFHPTFLYESFFNFLGFIVLILLAKKITWHGFRLYFYMAWYGIVRFFVEGMRSDSLYLMPGIRVSQIVSLFLFIGGLSLILYKYFHSFIDRRSLKNQEKRSLDNNM